MSVSRSDLPFATCRDCGAKIVWAKAPKAGGAPGEVVTLPLNVPAPVYRVVSVEGDHVRAEPARDHFVSHFATCRGKRGKP